MFNDLQRRALLAAALCLLGAGTARAQTQTTVWSATLVVDDAHGVFFGCDNDDDDQDDCSISTVLTDDDFTYGSTTYTIQKLYLRPEIGKLFLGFQGGAPAAARTALAGLTLHVDGTALAVSAATTGPTALGWLYAPATNWEDGTEVKVSLTPPGPPAAPTLDTVTVGERSLTASWTAPSGVSGITAYDLRWILTSADETVDANWTVVDDAWTGGPLHHLLEDLADGTGYDIQVRAVTTVDGAWSATVAGTPKDPSGSRLSGTRLPLDTPVRGYLTSGTDVDHFKVTLPASRTAFYFFRTLGDVDTVGVVSFADGAVLGRNDDSDLSSLERNFLVVVAPSAHSDNTVYVKITGYSGATGAYTMIVGTEDDTSGRSNARRIPVGGGADGVVYDSRDTDWFRFDLAEETDVLVRSLAPASEDLEGELRDSDGDRVAGNDDGFEPTQVLSFALRRTLAAGAWYVRVEGTVRATGGIFSRPVSVPYRVLVDAVTEPGSTSADALRLAFGAVEGGKIDPAGDEDWFEFELPSAGCVLLRAISADTELVGELFDSAGDSRTVHFQENPFPGGQDGVTLADCLPAGTWRLKLTAEDAAETGLYHVSLLRDLRRDALVSDCGSGSFTDEFYDCQWHLDNTGRLGGASGEDIRVEEVWSAGNLGEGINVAVVDGGLDPEHPDLVDNVAAARNHSYRSELLSPYNSHGTSVAGVVAARDNGIGGRGVAPRASVHAYNYVRVKSDSALADALTRHASDTAVSVNSWGPTDTSLPVSPPGIFGRSIEGGIASGWGGKGTLYVFAAGNEARDGGLASLNGYAAHHGVTAVCAVNDRGVRSLYSSEGPNLWVCAPSNDNRSGRAGIVTALNYGRYTGDFGGTSAAAPVVAGVAALVRKANEDLTWRDVKLILAGSARRNDASDAGWETGALKYGSLTERYHFNHEYGFGVVDAKAAVDLAEEWTLLPDFVETTRLSASPDAELPVNTAWTGTLTAVEQLDFIEFVEVDVTFDTWWFREMLVELVSPSGAVSVLSETNPDFLITKVQDEYRFGTARHLGEDSRGTWTLRVTYKTDYATAEHLRSWGLTFYGHRAKPGAPAIAQAVSGRRALNVSWTAPAEQGTSPVSSYDLRYILANAPDKADANWTVRSGVWSSGALEYTLPGLRDGTEYDVQMRAVNARGAGGWSDTLVGETLPNRAPETVGALSDSVLRVGEAAASVGLSGAFSDPDGDALTYAATSGDPAVVAVRVSGSSVRLTAVSAGSTTVTATATDIAGSNTAAEQRIGVRVRGVRGVAVDPATLRVDEGGSASYEVVLKAEPEGSVTISASESDADLSVSPSALTFTSSDWHVARTFTVEAEEDTDAAPDAPAAISHSVSGGDYGSVSAPSVTATIVENDASALSLPDVSGSEADGELAFEVAISRAGTSDVTVDYATSDGSARAGSDYTSTAGTLTFLRSSTSSLTIAVPLLDDAADEEEEETFDLTLSNVRNGLLAGGGSRLRVTGTIEDDDDPPVTASFASSSYEATEGGSVRVQVRLDRDPERTLRLPLESTPRGGVSPADYSGVPFEAVFGPGERSFEFLFSATDDDDDDDGEAVELSFGGSLPAGVTAGESTVLAINDNDGGSPPGGSPPGGTGGPGGPPPPPSDDDEDDGGGGGGGFGPPRAAIRTDAECADGLCRAVTGAPIRFEDASTGSVQRRTWDFGEGSSRSAAVNWSWSEPGFHEVTLRVSGGDRESTDSLVFLVEAASPAGTCAAGAETLCLRDSRFLVEVEWWTASGERGAGRVVRRGTNDSGLFSFFGGSNWEMLIKVLDGCALNGHVWVFGALTTDLGYRIAVTDTVTGALKEYRNEPGSPAPAVTDATAFPASCAGPP